MILVRWAFFTCLLPLLLAASGFDFSKCQERVSLSSYPIGESFGLAVTPDSLLFFSPQKPPNSFRILKYDPFMNLYLLKSPRKMRPMELWDKKTFNQKKELASISSRKIHPGRYVRPGWGLDSFARFSALTEPNSVITGICYHMYGLGTGNNGFIEAKLIRRFLRQKEIYYGDIGVRVKMTDKGVTVWDVDPFVKQNPFVRGDVITSIAGHKIRNLTDFWMHTMDQTEGNWLDVEFTRSGKRLARNTYVAKRMGGGFVPDTFLERLGLELDDKLVVTRLIASEYDELKWLRSGDRLIQIDRNSVYNLADLKEAFTLSKGRDIHLLVERGDFQFFVRVRSEKKPY